jgi:hypothetical protein
MTIRRPKSMMENMDIDREHSKMDPLKLALLAMLSGKSEI